MEYATVHVEAPRLPFEGQSSYSADYVPKQVPLPAVMEVLQRKVSAAFRSASSRSVARFHDTTVGFSGRIHPSRCTDTFSFLCM